MMTFCDLNLECKAAVVEKYLKELEENKTEENYARFFNAAIQSESDSHVYRAIEMIRVNIASTEGNKAELYYQLGVGLCRIEDGKGAKQALEECLKIDGSLWKARSLLENVELILGADEPKNTISKSKLLKHVAVVGGLALGATCGCLSKSKLLKPVALVGGLALGVACTMIFSWEELIEFAGGMKKAGELGESIEKMTVTSKDSYPTTDGKKAGLGTAGVVAGVVAAAFFIGLKKSSSG